jgi:Ribbon-helix-helix protein, copG family
MSKRAARKAAESHAPGTARLSVTIPADDYADLKGSAAQKRVSMAWIVRDAVHQYLRSHTPPFRS